MQGNSHRAEVRLLGTAAAPGVARATAYLLQQGRALVVRRRVDDPERELARLEVALTATRVEIAQLRADVARKLNESEAAIFDAHLLVLEDVALIDEVTKEVRRSGYNIEHCFETVAQRYIDIFAKMEDDFLRERAADIRDVTGRVLDQLLGAAPAEVGPVAGRQVVVALDLTPTETAGLHEAGVAAFVTEDGGRTSPWTSRPWSG